MSQPGSGRGEAPTRDQRRLSPYVRIKQAILSGDLSPGQVLTESSLAEWCQVSRTPIRESLSRLQHDGLVERTERGLLVRDITPGEVLDIYETRVILESAAARMAAERRDSRDLLNMRVALSRAVTVDDGDPTAMAVSNSDFHRVVWQASHNRSLVDMLERLNMHLGRHPATTLAYPGRWHAATEQHELLVEAIMDRDADGAADLASQHFNEARDIRLKLFVAE